MLPTEMRYPIRTVHHITAQHSSALQTQRMGDLGRTIVDDRDSFAKPTTNNRHGAWGMVCVSTGQGALP